MAKIVAKEISTNQEREAWEMLADKEGELFVSSKWISIFGKDAVRVGLFQKDGQLIGGLVCARLKLKVISVLAPMRFTPHCGLFYKNPSSNAAARNQWEKSISQGISAWLNAQETKVIQLPFPHSHEDMQRFTWDGFRVSPKYTYRLALKSSLDEIKSNFSQATKSALKKSEKSQLVMRETSDHKEVMDVLTDSMQSKSGSFRLGLTASEMKQLLGSGLAFALVAHKDSSPIAVGVFVHDGETCYYLLGGVKRAFAKFEGGTQVIYQGMAKAKNLGCQVFDFEGSMNPGIEHFFRGFGGELTPYHQLLKAPFVQRTLLRLKGRTEF